jgi:hypothetical protein
MRKVHAAHVTKVRIFLTFLVLLGPVHWLISTFGAVLWLWLEEEEIAELV